MPILDVNLRDGATIDAIVDGLAKPIKTIVNFSEFVYLQLPHAQLLWRVFDRATFAEKIRVYGTAHLYGVWNMSGNLSGPQIPAKLADPTGALVPCSNAKDVVLQQFYKAVEAIPVPWPELDDFVFFEDYVLKVECLGTCVLLTSNNGKTWRKGDRGGSYKNQMTHAIDAMITTAEMLRPVDRSKVQLTIKYAGSTNEPVKLLASAAAALKVIDNKLEQRDTRVLVHVKYLD